MILQEIDRVSFTILMDNSTDLLLANSSHAIRPPLTKNEKFILPLPIAEHGFSTLVSLAIPGEEMSEKNIKSSLFDCGPSENGVIHNAEIFGMDFDQLDGIILSHGHFDHFAGLANILRRISLSRRKSTSIDLFVHPDAFLKRWEIYQDGKKVKMPFLDEEHLRDLGALIHKNTGITLLPCEDSPSLLVTGEIPRKTSFEKGFPFQYVETRSASEISLVPDPLVRDDQAIVVNVKNKGLVILSGCGHAGIMNTIDYAKKASELDKVHAVPGGFHLPADGGIYEEAIQPTLEGLLETDPDYIIPCHCTGWKATNRIIQTMPEKFLQSSVGTVFTF
jgi:7,8-dihydropterin-6-yl-methyl-4-(beta-D-ribofuranosyl)aminobenzene 5'-phosphate synthase